VAQAGFELPVGGDHLVRAAISISGACFTVCPHVTIGRTALRR